MSTFQAREAPPVLLLDDRGKPATGRGSGLSWSVLKPFLSASPGRMIGLAGSSALGGLAEAAILVILVQLAVAISGDRDVVRGNGPLNLLEGTGVGTLFWVAAGLTVLRLLFQALNAHLTAQMSTDTVRRLRRETYGAFIEAQWSVKATEKDGHLQDLMSTHISRSANAVIVVSMALGALFSFGSLMISAVAVSPIASAVIIATTAVLFYVLRPLSGLTRRYSGEQARINLEYVNVVSESVAVAQELEVFDAGRAANARVMRLVDEFARWWYRNHVVSDFVRPLYQSLAVLLILGGLAALSSFDSVTMGSLGAVVVILVRALNYSSTLQANYTKLCELLPYMEVVSHARDTYRRHAVERGGSPLERIESLAFEDVGFAYRPGHPVLTDVTFAVRPGEAVGIIGPSGAGKSTMVQLLLRLRQPTSGRYLVNGVDAATFDRTDWFRRVALVAQDNRLVSGTVRDNIRFFRDWIDDDAIERAAKMAQIHDDITSWAEGYDTPVGERAGAVSGGQRQRICLARALAGEPDVIVLDEPTSALDVRSESLVHAALEDLKGQVTLFIVAHRLSTLNTCDRIMVFGGGRLQAFGSRRALQRGNRFYREAVELSQLR